MSAGGGWPFIGPWIESGAAGRASHRAQERRLTSSYLPPYITVLPLGFDTTPSMPAAFSRPLNASMSAVST